MKFFKLYIENINNKFFTYKDNTNSFEIGQWCIVSFGTTKKKALILFEDSKFNNQKIDISKVKAIEKNIPNYFNLSKQTVKLILWTCDYYLCNITDILKIIYPAKPKIKPSIKIRIKQNFIPSLQSEKLLIEYFSKKKDITKNTLLKHFEKNLIEKLVKNKILEEFVSKTIRKQTMSTNLYQKKDYSLKNINTLNIKQDEIKNAILKSKNPFSLIYGITGSGKTEIYIHLIADALKKRQGSLLLLPEIALTTSAIVYFKSIFQDNISVLHSGLSQKEKLIEIEKIRSGESLIVIGVRSAVFAQVKNLKYIIIDEEQENSYKQDSAPIYNAKFIALKRAKLENTKVIFGSATPSLEFYYFANKNIFDFYQLNERFNNAKLPVINIVDMTAERKIISYPLTMKIKKTLEKKEQVLLFLNKKGFAKFVHCKECGHVEKCKNCSVSLSYFSKANILKCNHCGFTKSFTLKCSKCKSDSLNIFDFGIEKIEKDVQTLFPEANILQVDADQLKTPEEYQKLYNDFYEKKYDILIGTQIIAKGFTFPELTLVGIINADSILNYPDFRASEKTFQLIVQVAGRAGRAKKNGEVLIQTYSPEHYAIDLASKSQFHKFYETELLLRKELKFPPYGKIINIILSSEDEKLIENLSINFHKMLPKNDKLEIYGPFKAALYKIRNRFRFQIFIKGNKTNIENYKKEIANIKKLKDFSKIRILIDIDPISLI